MAIEQKVADPKEKKTLDKKVRDAKPNKPKKVMAEPYPDALKDDYNSPDYKVAEDNMTKNKCTEKDKALDFMSTHK